MGRLSLPKSNDIKQRPKVSNNKKETRGLHNRKRPGGSTREEPLKMRLQSILCGQEAGVVALLLSPHASSRTLWPVHEAWAATLHMVEEVLWHLVQLAVAVATEEGYP